MSSDDAGGVPPEVKPKTQTVFLRLDPYRPSSTSKFIPHQGAKEKARRLFRMAHANLKPRT